MLKIRKIDVSSESVSVDSIFLCSFIHSGPQMLHDASPNCSVQMLIFSGNIFTNTHRSNVQSALWAFSGLVKLKRYKFLIISIAR